MVGRAVSTAMGLLMDALVGEPPRRAHPVAAFGSAMSRLERCFYAPRRTRGVLYAAAGVALAFGAGSVGQAVVGPGPALLGATWLAVAGRELRCAAEAVSDALEAGDLERARTLLPSLVGRDPAGLDEAEMARAVVESLADNTVDAVVAPAFWGALGGAPWVLGYRAINTLDAMVGHRSSRYESFGWASARLDDLAAWLPSRLLALGVCLLRPARARAVLRCVRLEAPAHPSPNAGVAEAAFAAALGVRLGGVNRYGERVEPRAPLGFGGPPSASHIGEASRLSAQLGSLAAVVLLAVEAARIVRLGRRP